MIAAGHQPARADPDDLGPGARVGPSEPVVVAIADVATTMVVADQVSVPSASGRSVGMS